jgi:uncharacterized protein YrrD
MRKGKSIIGLQATSEVDGAELGAVKDLIFDHSTDEIIGLLISDKELFGLIDAQVIPWNQVRAIGSKAVMVAGPDAKVRAGDEPRINAILDRNTALSGTRIRSMDGDDLGTFADLYIDEQTGRILGYEVSGGFFSDTMSGKHYLPASTEITMGQDVAIVPATVAHELEAKKQDEPGGLKGAVATAKDKATDVYGNVATASVEKQKEFVVGKTASRDVFLPADQSTATAALPSATTGMAALEATSETQGLNRTSMSVENTSSSSQFGASTTEGGLVSTPVDESTTVYSIPSSEIVSTSSTGSTPVTSETSTSLASTGASTSAQPQGEILVHQGEVITREHADRAESAGILHQLLVAAGGTMAGGVLDAGKERLGAAQGALGGAQGNAEEMVIGKVAGTEVTAHDGSTIVAPGMVITQQIMDHARAAGLEKAVIASAGVGTASQGADVVKTHATNLWDTLKEKAADLTDAAHGKRAEYDAQAEQKRINDALGRPTTRVILDPSDHVILNTGDLITHAAIDRARQAGALEVLLDSVYTVDPEITPEMLRAREPGEAALPTQAVPSGGPITATVAPDASQGQPAQDGPAQGAQGGQSTTS